ncbi:LysR family transcriptional regulator [Ancylobacter lacus]|uniref:LysR family transcriptional regulator n=1 Tax=Ancylobacter lacus TaxID=2579970 RepID=UPI001BCDB653|nr:LysR family transcriptional regulator [Ancylobacter lacus]MBS7538222.1 LysR family transcriptional regulator [Ancylobacter lacus]
MRKKSTPSGSQWLGKWSRLRDLEIICAIVAERKTTTAAQRLGMSQPGVSRAIAAIEKRHGKVLFHREGGRLQPTAEALVLHRLGSAAFSALAALDGSLAEPVAEHIVVSALPTMCHCFLVGAVADFLEFHPQVSISLYMADAEDPAGSIAEGRVDVGVSDSVFLHSGVSAEPLLQTSAVCVMPSDHHLAAKPWIGPDDLDDERFVATSHRHSQRAALDRIFSDSGVMPKTTVEIDTVMDTVEMIRRGFGVSILNPFPIARFDVTGLELKPFRPEFLFQTNVMLSANRPMSVSVRRFVDFLKDRCRSFGLP